MVLCAWKARSSRLRHLALFREDCLERIRHLQAEIDAPMTEMAQLKKEHAATEERIKRLNKEMGYTM